MKAPRDCNIVSENFHIGQHIYTIAAVGWWRWVHFFSRFVENFTPFVDYFVLCSFKMGPESHTCRVL